MISMDVNPYTAFVIWPVLVASVAGSAKNARYASECPSSRKIRLGPSCPSVGVTRRILALAADGPMALVATDPGDDSDPNEVVSGAHT